MSRSTSTTIGILVALAGMACVASDAAAQATKAKETVAAGPATVTKYELKGEVVAVGSNWLVAKDPAGAHKVYNIQTGRKFIVDGVPKTLSQLQKGTFLTAQITVTETPVIQRTTTLTEGTVFWSSPTSLIVTHGNGENKQYAVPDGFKFKVDGNELSAMELRPGMKLSATKVVEEPVNLISQDAVVTGTAPR